MQRAAGRTVRKIVVPTSKLLGVQQSGSALRLTFGRRKPASVRRLFMLDEVTKSVRVRRSERCQKAELAPNDFGGPSAKAFRK